MKFHSQLAYTFIEVMISLTIIAILAAISIPSLRHYIDHNNDVILQSQLMRAIQLGRQEAYSRGMPVSICKSKDHVTCGGAWEDGLLVFEDDAKNGIVQDKQNIISVVQINLHHGKLNWRAYPLYREYLQFTPTKWMSGDNGMFWYCRSKNIVPIFGVVISKSGSAHTIQPDEQGEMKDSRGRLIQC